MASSLHLQVLTNEFMYSLESLAGQNGLVFYKSKSKANIDAILSFELLLLQMTLTTCNVPATNAGTRWGYYHECGTFSFSSIIFCSFCSSSGCSI
ncbi:hypothetical protein BVC80_9067g47 [Macleaya cordata]|uniref:Uncharacterized protein n=1 Tax=Macleaya cordata TaxID=56857 RepID=A0A200PNS3_MACCD|nr:hypothetical protein BVC80_9067g47 [Macleaya cordata]